MTLRKKNTDVYLSKLDELQAKQSPNKTDTNVTREYVRKPIEDESDLRLRSKYIEGSAKGKKKQVLRSNAAHAYIVNLEGYAYTASILVDLIATIEYQRARRERMDRAT